MEDNSIKIKARGNVVTAAINQAAMQGMVPARASIGPCKSQAMEPMIEPTPTIQAPNEVICTLISVAGARLAEEDS